MLSEQDPRESIRPASITETDTSTLTKARESIPTMEVRKRTADDEPRFLPGGVKRSSYLLNDVIGRGAEGVVWSAVQVNLDRIVAVKTFNRDADMEGETEEQRQASVMRRFYEEALITARLPHPNIVPVHDIGITDDGRPLLAMKRVRGRPWSSMLKDDFRSMGVEQFLQTHLQIFVSMMQAVAFAHSQGVIHRDLKPAQLMVGEFGEVVLLDWGIAVLTEDAEELYRQTGDLPPPVVRLPTVATAPSPAGTPALMAPEQTEATAQRVSFRTDVYLLGGILYFILTGTYPHDAESSTLSMAQASKGDIVHPEKRTPGRQMPRELVDLCLRALERDPENRVHSVVEFIDSVRDFQTGASARRQSTVLTEDAAGRLERMQGLGLRISELKDDGFAVEFTRDSCDLDGIYGALEEIRVLLERAGVAWGLNPALGPLRDRVVAASARTAEMAGDIRVARHLAMQISAPGPREAILRAVSQKESERRRKDGIRRLAIAGVGILLVVVVAGTIKFSADQRAINTQLAVERDLADRMRDEALRQRAVSETAMALAQDEAYFAKMNLASFALSEASPNRVAKFLMETRDYPYRHWEWGYLLNGISNDSMTIQRSTEVNTLLASSFSVDGSIVYTGDRSGAIYAFDATTGGMISKVSLHDDGIWDIVPSRDGTRLLICSFDKSASIIDVRTKERIHHLKGHTELLRGGAISPDGTRVVTTSRDSTVRVWSMETGEEIMQLPGIEFTSYAVDYSPDGSLLVAAARRRVTIHDGVTGELLSQLPDHPENVLDVDFSPDGTMLATACTDRYVRIYSVPDFEEVAVLHHAESWLHSLAWHPDGSLLVSTGNGSEIRIWDTTTWELMHSMMAQPRLFHARFSPTGREFVTVTPRAVQMWRMDRLPSQDGFVRMTADAENHPNPNVYTFARSSPLELEGAWIGFDWAYRRPEGNGRQTFRHRDLVLAVDSYYSAIEPNGSRVVFSEFPTLEGSIRDFAGGEVIGEWPYGRIFRAVWSQDGRFLASINTDGEFRLHDGVTLEPIFDLGAASPVSMIRSARFVGVVAFDPESRFVATGRRDGGIQIWSTEDGSLIRDLTVPDEAGIFAAAFSRDGRYFAAGGLSARAHLWDTRDWERLATYSGHSEYILDIDFHPDNQRIVTSSHDNTLKLWETFTGREVLTVFSFPDARFVLGGGFSASGREIYCIASNGHVYLAESLDWKMKGSPMEIRLAAEVEKRQRRVNPNVRLSDVNQLYTADTDLTY